MTTTQHTMTGAEQHGAEESGTGIQWFSISSDFAPSDNLTQRLAGEGISEGPFDQDRRYEQFFESLARALHRVSPRHVLIKRQVGVGDHAVLASFAGRMLQGRYPDLADKQLVRIDCRFIPPDEARERLAFLTDVIRTRQDVIVCLEGISAFFASGTGNELQLLFSKLPQLESRVIGVVSHDEYETHFAGRQAVGEFFSEIDLHEPEVESAKRIVGHFARGLERQFNVKIDDAAVERTVVLSDSYIPSKRLPRKAVEVLQEVCQDLAFDQAYAGSDQATVSESGVIEKIAHISGVPAATLAGLGDGIDYVEALGSKIVGQEHVISEVATELGLIRAGLLDPGKPASVMMLIGQTGTGKTELAKVIAKLYSSSGRLKTFTLGNYSEPHSVSGIIGVPPGYVGHDHGGRLVNELNADPYSVFLLDEADKAHPDVMQPFLNLFDQGWVIDQRGQKAYADRAIFILTTNIGQRQIADMHSRGKSWDEINTKLRESLSQIRHTKSNRPVFTSEFLARIKRIMVFKPLSGDAMRGITDCVLSDIQQGWLDRRQRRLVIDSAITESIAEIAQKKNEDSKGKEGGRIVRKLFADRVEANIQEAISRSPEDYKSCNTVQVSAAKADTKTEELDCSVRFSEE